MPTPAELLLTCIGPSSRTDDHEKFLRTLANCGMPGLSIPELTPENVGLPQNQIDNLRRARIQEQAYTAPRDPRIHINTESDVYRGARKGQTDALLRLVAQIDHERDHIWNGPDEASAYDTQLKRLRTLGASKGTLRDIEAAKAWALKQPVDPTLR